jgi:hypothetical protein
MAASRKIFLQQNVFGDCRHQEPVFVGGRIIERGTDGSQCPWSRILANDPPHRVVLDISSQWGAS